ncbi:MAG: efflux RND transporter permease subunit, partial [Myxococcota bacterium]
WQFIVDDAFAEHYPAMVRDLRYRLATDPDLARSSVKEVQAGPPTGASVTARIRGRDPEALDGAMAAVKEALYAMDGITDVSDNYGAGKETFRVEIDQDRAALYGLTERDVAQAVRTALDGLLAAEVSIDEEPVEILVRYAGARASSRNALGDLLIRAPGGGVVRLDQVAALSRVRDVAKIIREDGLRTVVVYADADKKVLVPAQAAAALQEAWDEDIAGQYPDLRLSFGGEADELADSLKDLPYAFALAFAGIYIVLALQFRSYLQPAIIMSAVPFGLMGAIWGLTASGYPLSLMSMFGMVALTGIVVNDSLVMVDFINKRRREGASLADGVRQGALQRLRPIVSTTLTTCLGLLPLAIGLGGQDLVLAPMALAITAGLGIATLLVLLVVPALYLVVEGVRQRLGGGQALVDAEDAELDEELDEERDQAPADEAEAQPEGDGAERVGAGQTVPAPAVTGRTQAPS